MKTRWRTLVVAENASGEALAARLRADGHQVDIARSGQEAIDRAREQQYLTYFVEFEVADMDGAEIMKEIRRAHPEASIVVTCPGLVTSEEEFVSMARMAAAGQTGHLQPMSLADMEKLLICATLRHTGGNIKESAAILGIDRSTLYEKIKKYEIPR
jgi:DNA-binding NtrC family response regulator